MTRNDDEALRLLERDLRGLAEPREFDAQTRLRIREQLAAGVRPRARRRPSMRAALGWAALTATAAAVGLIALTGSVGTAGPAAADAAIIHHALRAVTPPPDEILHVKVVGTQNGVAVAGETWQETSPPYAFRGLKGETGHQGEFGDNGRFSFQYSPQTGIVQEQRDTSRLTFTDPMAQVRYELARGQAHVIGLVKIGGASLYKIDLPHGLIGYFGVGDYRPRYLDDPQRDGTTVRLRVVAYQYLPMTPANRALVSVTAQHPGARVETSAGGQQVK
jgi:hypothetical protein